MTKAKSSGGTNWGFEQTLWLAADVFPGCQAERVAASLSLTRQAAQAVRPADNAPLTG